MTNDATHRTNIRRRHGIHVVSCSCGWSQDAISSFGAWLASRRHIEGFRSRQVEHAASELSSGGARSVRSAHQQ